ncbi:MAG TPA: ABC transporter ATP-binding protein [Desulfomonilaceae bacterium]|nr:ABC transporter ATP-binding protein [Desulfomonilaceae bacterium]
MLSVENVSFAYGAHEKPVFRGLNLTVSKGSWVLITGLDGSGKTTLCKLLKGLLQPLSGTIRYDFSGQELIGYLGGDPYDSLVGISVAEDVIFGLENLGLSQKEMEKRLEQALRWTGLSGMEERLVHTLSGGEQQKLALAGALAMGAVVVILDEALNMVDRSSRSGIRRLLEHLRRVHDLTIIEAGHQFHHLMDRIIFLADRDVFVDGSPELFRSSQMGGKWIEFMGGFEAFRQAVLRWPGPTRARDALLDFIMTIDR